MQLFTHQGWFRRWGVCLAIGAGAVLPAMAAEPTNSVQMVTYFPVPYARYNNLYIQKKLDIGTVNQPFEVITGTTLSGCADVSLKATNVNLRNISGSPALKVSQDFVTNEATFGNMDETGSATLSFKNLYLKGTGDMTFSVIQANKLQVKNASKIYMLKSTLPGCTTGKVAWTKLSFKDSGGTVRTGDYLVCCDSSTTEGCREECIGYNTQPQTCAGSNPHGNSAIEGQVSGGTWRTSASFTDDSCFCDCSSVSYTASGSGQSVTGANRKHANELEDKDDYDYCQQYCWDDYTSGAVENCTSPENPPSYATNGTWHYGANSSQCYCTCPTDYKEVGGQCYHYCYKNIDDGDVARCESTSGASWNYSYNDSYCGCSCPAHFDAQSDGSCKERCEAGAPNWDSIVKSCASTKGDGSGWSTSSCTCSCGKKDGEDMEWNGSSCVKKS